jgi:hypothetical protein
MVVAGNEFSDSGCIDVPDPGQVHQKVLHASIELLVHRLPKLDGPVADGDLPEQVQHRDGADVSDLTFVFHGCFSLLRKGDSLPA